MILKKKKFNLNIIFFNNLLNRKIILLVFDKNQQKPYT